MQGAVYVPILLTVATCVFARQIGERLGVIDHPDTGRKSHSDPTPLVGGIAIMVPIIVWEVMRIVFQGGQADGFALVIVLCAGGVAVVGFIDDQRTISPTGRLVLLAIFSLVALKLDPHLVVSGLHTLTWGWVPIRIWLSTVLVVSALAGFCSAVNMVDGANGLVLSLVCVWAFCLTLTGGAGTDASELLGVASLITLLFNARGRLFLGDCGAFALSFVIGIIAIACHNQGRVPLETVAVWFLLPVVDCLRLIPARVLYGRSPFRPDRLHFHHRLSDRLGERRAIGAYAGLVAVTSLAATLKPELSTACIYLDFTLYLGFMLADVLAPGAVLANRRRADEPKVVTLIDKKRRET